jgi:solute carrier family 35 protein
MQGDKGASSTSELLWYNALTALPLLSVITAAHGDVFQVSALAAKGLAARGSLYFFTMVIGAATLGCLLNYSMFLCTMYNSALTTTIVGVLRGVATVLLGFMLDTVPFSVLNIAGITLNTCGGVWYTWIKYQDKLAGSSSSTAGLRKGGGSQGLYAKLPTEDEVEGHSTSVESPAVSLRMHEGSGGGRVSVKVQT